MVKRSSLFHKQGNPGSEQRDPAQVILRVCPSGGAGCLPAPVWPLFLALQLFIPNTGINLKFSNPSSQRLPEVSAQFGTGPTPTEARRDDAPAVLGLPESSLGKPERRGHRGRAAEEGEAGSGHFRGPDLGPRPYARARKARE